MLQSVLCLFCLLVTHFKLAYQSQHHVDGSSGLKRAVLIKGAAQVSYGHFVADKFHRLQVAVGLSTTVMSYRECSMGCVNTPPCVSFNVASSPDVDGKFRCELLNEDKYNSFNQLISSQQYHHFSIKVSFDLFVFSYFELRFVELTASVRLCYVAFTKSSRLRTATL